MDIYADLEEDNIRFIYMRFYNNLILAGKPEDLKSQMIKSMLKKDILVIMGRDDIIEKVAAEHKVGNYTSKYMYQLNKDDRLMKSEIPQVKVATIEEADKIYEFLMTIEGFDKMYSNKEMIINRIKNNEGIHIFIEKKGHIIAHGNSAAKCQYTNMIGGISVIKEERNKEWATKIVSYLSAHILKEGRIPCMWSEKEKDSCLLTSLGYEQIGKWGTIS
jgi:predicted GNAT family acetyltransferase